MQPAREYHHIGVSLSGPVATVEMRRPPNNFVDTDMVAELADAFETFDAQPECRAIVLCSEGRHFSAGADFSRRGPDGTPTGGSSGRHLYKEMIRLFRTSKPVVVAVQGAAVGAGLGLALVGDFRVSCKEARFVANFTRLGYHPGFGLTVTLPRVIGAQQTTLLFFTGRRLPGEDAAGIGLVDMLVPEDEVRTRAQAFALEIAQSAPLAIVATRETLRRGLADAVQAASEREFEEQDWLSRTEDFSEGTKAMAERRLPDFKAR